MLFCSVLFLHIWIRAYVGRWTFFFSSLRLSSLEFGHPFHYSMSIIIALVHPHLTNPHHHSFHPFLWQVILLWIEISSPKQHKKSFHQIISLFCVSLSVYFHSYLCILMSLYKHYPWLPLSYFGAPSSWLVASPWVRGSFHYLLSKWSGILVLKEKSEASDQTFWCSKGRG